MTLKAFIDVFFTHLDTKQYSTYQNRNGQRAADFGHKQLHEGHLETLYQWALSHNGELSTADFAALVPGRPCASVPFFETCTRARLCALVAKKGTAKIYHFK
jgi:hypothetical protein